MVGFQAAGAALRESAWGKTREKATAHIPSYKASRLRPSPPAHTHTCHYDEESHPFLLGTALRLPLDAKALRLEIHRVFI